MFHAIPGYSVENMPPEIKCTVSEMDTFLELVKQKCPSFIQKRCLLKGMKEVQGRFEEFEKRLANFEQLSADEQELYDSSVEMQQKITALTKQVQDMVDKNKLTKCENATLQKELSEKLTKLNEALKAAKDEPKKSAKLEAQRDALKTQIEKLKAAPTVKFQKKNEKEIAETKQKIEQMKANMGAMKAIQDYEAKLEKLRAEQRGWFWSEVSQEDKGLGTTKKK